MNESWRGISDKNAILVWSERPWSTWRSEAFQRQSWKSCCGSNGPREILAVPYTERSEGRAKVAKCTRERRRVWSSKRLAREISSWRELCLGRRGRNMAEIWMLLTTESGQWRRMENMDTRQKRNTTSDDTRNSKTETAIPKSIRKKHGPWTKSQRSTLNRARRNWVAWSVSDVMWYRFLDPVIRYRACRTLPQIVVKLLPQHQLVHNAAFSMTVYTELLCDLAVEGGREVYIWGVDLLQDHSVLEHIYLVVYLL